ncbi:MAG TPA: hypothetical protein VF399_11460 [bacterium]|jgi:hypothetical protein
MTKRMLMSLVLKILAVMAIMYGITLVPLIFFALTVQFSPLHVDAMSWYAWHWYLVMAIAQPLVFFVLAFILLRWCDFFARKLITDDSLITSAIGDEWEKQFFTLALRIIGVVCVVYGIPLLVENACQLKFMSWWGNPFEWAKIVSGFVLIFTGIYLLSGGKRVVAYAFRVPHHKDESSNNGNTNQ